jgi:uncharacterized protein (TIGR03000 family)
MRRNVWVLSGLACLALLGVVSTADAQRRGGSNWGNTIGNAIDWATGNNYNQGGYYGQPGYGYGPYNQGGWGQNQWYGQPYSSNWGQTPWHVQGYGRPYYSDNVYFYPNQGYTYQPGFSSGGGYASTNQYQSFYAGPGGQQQDQNQALVRVITPDQSARVWLEGQEMPFHGGQERTFISPPLQRGSNYVYTIRATWNENGREVNRERKVPVTAGQQVMVNFRDGDDPQQRFDGQQQRLDGQQQRLDGQQQQRDRQELNQQERRPERSDAERNRDAQPQAQPADQRNRDAQPAAPAPKQPSQQQQQPDR